MFNIKTVRVILKKKQEETQEVVVVVPKRNYRHIITRELGVGNKILITVFDKWQGRFVYSSQADLKKGAKHTEYVKRQYKNSQFIDKLDNSDVLFEF